jgi:hypothetical protein
VKERMDERKVAKDALKKEYLKEIAQKLVEDYKVPDDDICVNGSGRINLDVDDIAILRRIAKDLADKLADTQAELYLQKTQSTKVAEN